MDKDVSKKSTRRSDRGKPLATAPISRRSFIKAGTVLGVSSLLAGGRLAWRPKAALAATGVDIAAVQGADYYQNTLKAVEILGGMGRFVAKQSRVGLLINSDQDNPGTYVKPEITLAVVNMCLEAGAREVGVFKSLGSGYWRRSPLAEKFGDAVRQVRYIGGDHVEVTIARGRSLKKAEVAKALLDCDVFINMPIAKDHTAVRFTGTLKNMMGTTSSSTNRFFHFGSGSSGWYDDAEFLSQCITDVNLVRAPDLCVFDGTELVTTNGPSGPGKIIRPQKVFAGTDRVALDVYGADLLGLPGDEILATRMAHAHGLGEIDPSALRVHEVAL